MKVILLVLLAIAFAADIKKAGTTTSSTLFNYPLWTGTPVACAAQTSQKSYVSFPVTLTAPKTYHLYGHTEQGLLSSLRVIFYTTFDPANPCANIQQTYLSTGKRPCINELITVPAGTTTVVVFSQGNAGTFSLQLLETLTNGNNLYSPYTWFVPTQSSSGCAVSSTKTRAGFYSWTQGTSGVYDYVVLLKNTTLSSPVMHVVLFNGSDPIGNNTENINVCNNANYIKKDYVSSSSSPVEVFGTATLVAGENYTIGFSFDGLWAVGDYAVRIRPTETAWMPSDPKNYNTPSYSAPCSPTGAMKYYSTYYFTAQYPVYIIDQGNFKDYYDLDGFLYEGLNLGSWTQGPSSCNGYIMGGDLGDVTVLFKLGMIPGNNYTALITLHGTPAASHGNYTYRRLMFTGEKIGDVPEIPPQPAVPTLVNRNCSTVEIRWVQATGMPTPTDYRVEYALKTGTPATWGSWSVVSPAWGIQKYNNTDFRLTHYLINCPSTLKYRLSALNTIGWSLPSPETAEITPWSGAGRVAISFGLLFALLLLLF